jgi:hypothetical protein
VHSTAGFYRPALAITVAFKLWGGEPSPQARMSKVQQPVRSYPGDCGRSEICGRQVGSLYLTPNGSEGSALEYFDLASKSTRTVYRSNRQAYSGIALSPDHRLILFSQIERSPNHDGVLVEHFR